ncbi:MAG: hypothetical protein CMF62_07695 [Magnetococcales bacterium]|nr:hypothetical protein [Magnetococcales bacterium]
MKNFFNDFFKSLRFTMLRHYLTPATWYILAGSLVVVNALTFYVGDLWGSNNATMSLFWGYFPFVMTVLAPLLAMRGVALERQMGTYDWQQTKPLNQFAVDAATFKSQMLMFTMWLVASMVLPVAFGFLANPDVPLIASGYVGALLLGGVFIAASFMAASLAHSMVVAFMGGFLVSMLLLFTASEGLATLMPFAIPTEVNSLVMALSPLHAFDRLQNGLILVADIALLLSLQVIFFMLGHMFRQWSMLAKGCKAGVGCVIVAAFAVIVLTQVYVSAGQDLTADNRYKPSPSALQLVQDLPAERVTIQFYYSNSSGALSAEDRAYGHQVKYYLQTLARLSDKVRFSMIDPTHSAKLEQAARRQKIEPVITADGTRIYMGLVASTPEKSIVIPALPRERRDVFEFDLMNNLVRLRHEQTRRIVVLTGMNMADEKQRPKFLEKLAPFYRVDISNHRNAVIPDDNDLVIVLNGYFLGENSLYALDQYVQRGGKVLAFVDPFWFASPSGSMQASGPDDGVTAKPGFDDLLQHWGMGYIPGRVVADPSLGTPIQVTDSAGVATHPLWLTLKSGEINQDTPISRGLTKISMAATGFFDILDQETVSHQPILQTSPAAKWIERSKLYEANLENMADYFEGVNRTYILAAKASGTFKPFYEQRPEEVNEWFTEKSKDWPENYKYPHATEAKPSKVIAVADMDIYSPQLSLRGEGMSPSNDNLNLVFNMVRDLLDEPEALSIKLRYEANRRPFIGIDKQLTNIAAHFAEDEQELISKLMNVRRNLADLRHEQGRKRFEDPVLEKQIAEADFKELQIMHEIDEARETAFSAAKHFIGAVTLLIVFGGGLLLGLYGWMFKRRYRGRVKRKLKKLRKA